MHNPQDHPTRAGRGQKNTALPQPLNRLERLEKEGAFMTLAVEDLSKPGKKGQAGSPSDAKVEDARDWVEYDEL